MADPILTVLVTLDGGAVRPLTANRHKRLTGVAAAKIVRRWRDAACEAWLRAAETRGIVSLAEGALTIEAQPYLSDGQYVPDVGAHAPTLKAIIDGMREPTAEEAKRGIAGAGLIPDDTPAYIGRIVWLPAVHHSDLGHGLRVKVYATGDAGTVDGLAWLHEPEQRDYDGPSEALIPGKLGAADHADYGDDDPLEDSGAGTGLDDDPEQAWLRVRESAVHAAYKAWEWMCWYHAHASMRKLAKLTGIKRPTLIRWMNSDLDDQRSRADNPADVLCRMLSPEQYAEMLAEGRVGGGTSSGYVRNGGPWPIPSSQPGSAHLGHVVVVNGRWYWLCGCGQRGPTWDTEGEAVSSFHDHAAEPEPEDEPF